MELNEKEENEEDDSELLWEASRLSVAPPRL